MVNGKVQSQPAQSCALLVRQAELTKAEHQSGRREYPDALQVIAGAVEHIAGQAGQGAGDQGCFEARVGPLGVDCSQTEASCQLLAASHWTGTVPM